MSHITHHIKSPSEIRKGLTKCDKAQLPLVEKCLVCEKRTCSNIFRPIVVDASNTNTMSGWQSVSEGICLRFMRFLSKSHRAFALPTMPSRAIESLQRVSIRSLSVRLCIPHVEDLITSNAA